MNPEFKPQFDKAVAAMKSEMERDPSEVWPRVFGYHADDRLTWMQIDPAMMADWRDKNKIAAMIVKHCFSTDATCAIFLSDSFTAQLPQGKMRADMPAYFGDWPKHLVKEALLVVLNARGIKGEFYQWSYTRGPENQRIFAPEIERPEGAISNRFAFDLRDTTESAALADALLRGREGTIKVVA